MRKAFRRILEKFGVLLPVANPERDADRIYRSAQAHGIECALLTFNPPQYTPTELACPTIPVFAWEFDTIPNETWNANPREDWRYVFERIDTAITHSSASVQAVRAVMGPTYPVWSIPAPVFQGKARHVAAAKGYQSPTELVLRGALAIDATAVDLSLFEATRPVEEGARALRLLRRAASDPTQPPQTLSLSGVVYTTVLNPNDGRKNWDDMAAGFVWAFRDTPDATLVLKLTHADMIEGVQMVLKHLVKLKPFKCRIVVVHGLLDDEAYDALVAATSYTVNTANGEGQCLPLMEFMSAGRPAVAPRHTAMIDYISTDNAFVIASRSRPAFWPHDERHAVRCTRNEVVFVDVVRQFRESYRVACEDPGRYAAMSAAAVAALQAFCSDEVVTARLAEVLRHQGLSPKIVPLRSAQPPVARPAQEATA